MGPLPGGDALVDMMRLDAILKEKSSDSIYYKEYKTTSYGDARWSMYYEHNAQVMANLAGLEEALGIRPAGILIEGHVKGARRIDTAKTSPFTGMPIQDSPLCYTYDRGGVGNYSTEWRSGAVRRGVWETGFTPRQWVATFLSEEECRGLFVQLPPISPDPFHVERWRRQKVAQEGRINDGLALLTEPSLTEAEKTSVLDRVFPLYEQSCIRYGRKCSHWEICHDRAVAMDPVSTGNYIERIPHHQAELVLSEGADSSEAPILQDRPAGRAGEAGAPAGRVPGA
jgi:hypothetical protein